MLKQSRATTYPPPEQITRAAAIKASCKQLKRVLEVVFDDADTLRILLREAVGLDAHVESILAEIDETLVAIVEHDLRLAQTAGYVRDLEPRMVATMIVGGVEKIGLAALRSDVQIDLDLLAHEATMLHAIGTLSDRLKEER